MSGNSYIGIENISCFEKEHDAILTHYAHNFYNGVSEHYKSEAIKIIDSAICNKQKTNNPLLLREKFLKELLSHIVNVPFPTGKNYTFKFIDLFAGIGGFRLAMQNVGGKCIYSSEWDKYAQETYRANFGEVPFGDISKESIKAYIPKNFDILCAGFPCQAFSIAGYRKGFADTRGTSFFDIEDIIQKHKPKVVFIENVKNLVSHDNGKTFKIIIESLEKKLKYKVYHKILNTMTYANIPQNRERIFIVAFDPIQVKNHKSFSFPSPIPLSKNIHSILEQEKQDDKYYYSQNHKYYPELVKSMTDKHTVYQWRRVYVRKNKNNVCPTLTANMGTGGHNVPLIKDNFGYRKLTPMECLAFQGYPIKKYILPPLTNNKLYMQIGNSVTITLVEKICNEIKKVF